MLLKLRVALRKKITQSHRGGAPDRIRTCNLFLVKKVLCPLSYEGTSEKYLLLTREIFLSNIPWITIYFNLGVLLFEDLVKEVK